MQYLTTRRLGQDWARDSRMPLTGAFYGLLTTRNYTACGQADTAESIFEFFRITFLTSSEDKPSGYWPLLMVAASHFTGFRDATKSPNHALQRTAPRVTVAAILARTRLVRSWLCPTSVALLCAPPSQLPRHAPPSLRLGSLVASTPILHSLKFQQRRILIQHIRKD